MTETKIRPMTLVDYIDPGSGVPVKACSPDNGQTYKIYFTPWGIVWHADDVEVLWNDFLLDKVKSVMSIDWDSIKNKPKLVTQDQLNERLAKLSVPTINWSDIQNKPDVATQEDLKNIELKPGPQGPQGLPGKDGITPHIDSTTGDWFVGNQDTGTQAQGPAGKNGRDGVNGQPGKDGQNGITPHIDTATGNWFVGSTDTGIKAQGPQGIQGVPGKDGAPGRDGTEVDLSGYATKEAVEQAQTTADDAYKASSDNTKSISQLSTRVDGIKMPDLSGYAKTSQIPTDVVTHAELTTTKWLDTGTTWLNGNTGSVQYRSITIGNYHIVEVTGSMYITTKAYAITSAFKIPLLGFEDSTTMHFSGGSTITNEIPVSFMAGDPGEAKLYTWQNVNNGWTEVHLSWTYVGGD